MLTEISILQLALSFVFIIVLLVISKIKGLSNQGLIIVASLRMTIQLIITGYLLKYILKSDSPWITLLILIIMEAFAIFNVYKRSKVESIKLKELIAICFIGSSLVSIFYYIIVVVGVRPWYDPRYFITISGMLIGNTMTGMSLAINSYKNSLTDQRDTIESALMLGAKPKDAVLRISREAFGSAILPTLNSMLGMGIVLLPGMMTGQILSGTDPMSAILYQITIMIAIVGTVGITTSIFTSLAYKAFFNDREQILF